MSAGSKLRVAVAGLGFGAEFVPIYRDHPDVAEVTICDPNADRLAAAGERFGIGRRFANTRGHRIGHQRYPTTAMPGDCSCRPRRAASSRSLLFSYTTLSG